MKHVVILIGCVGSILLSPVLSAHSGATGIVKERMDSMKTMGKASKIIAKQLKAKDDLEQSLVMQQADLIDQHSRGMSKLFPKHSVQGKSEALDTIWLQWDDFVALSRQTSDAAVALKGLVASGADTGALRRQFGLLGKSCKSCHSEYRKKRN